jgi:hypothetical protein
MEIGIDHRKILRSMLAMRYTIFFFTILNNVELPIYQKCKLFDSLVSPILNFGSEIWGMHPANDIEHVHTKFLRRMLSVKKSTNLNALYGELARIPMSVIRKINMIKYWVKILNQDESSLQKKVYIMLKTDCELGNVNDGNWAFQIKSILQEHGFLYVWLQQSDIYTQIPFLEIKQRIIDNFLQRWYSEVVNSRRLETYSLFKHAFERERYLEVITDQRFKNALARFRTSSHRLNIEIGRYNNVPRDQRVCLSCNMNILENEYHFLLVCPKYRELRRKYLKNYYCHWPTLTKFKNLMSSTSNATIISLSKFIYFATKLRVS